MKKNSFYISEISIGPITKFQDSEFDFAIEDKRLIDLFDERDYSKISRSNYYAIQVTPSYKIYTLINPSIGDNLGRDGCRIINLLSTNKFGFILNFKELLDEVDNEYSQNNDLNKVYFDSILIKINEIQNQYPVFTHFQAKKKFYFLFSEDNSNQIQAIFGGKNPYLVEKIYAFDRDSVLDEHARNKGLIPLDSILYKESQINFDYGYLQKIQIGTEFITNFGSSPITLLYPKSETPIAYLGSKSIQTPIINSVETFRKPQSPKPPKPDPDPDPDPSFLKWFLISGLSVLSVLVVAFLIFFDFGRGDSPKPRPIPTRIPDPTPSPTSVPPVGVGEPKVPKDLFIMDTLSEKRNTYYFTRKISSIQNWPFAFVDSKWIYYKGFGDFSMNKNQQSLNAGKINEFISSNRINPVDWNRFADSLKVKSGHDVPKHTAPKPTLKPAPKATPRPESKPAGQPDKNDSEKGDKPGGGIKAKTKLNK